MPGKLAITAAVIMLACSRPALAVETPHYSIGSYEGSKAEFVWKDSEAMHEGFKLLAQGVHKTNPMLVMQELSCVAPVGSKIALIDSHFFSGTADIIVTEGDISGCKGVIRIEALHKD